MSSRRGVGRRPVLLPPAASSSHLLGDGDDDGADADAAGGATLTEVPLLFHSSPSGDAVRYLVSDVDETVLPVSADAATEAGAGTGGGGGNAAAAGGDGAEGPDLGGCASATVLTPPPLGGRTALVATAALAEEPSVLLLSVLPYGPTEGGDGAGGGGEVGSSSIELDLSGCREFDRPVKVACFVDRPAGPGDDEEEEDAMEEEEEEVASAARAVLRANLVDSAGVILSLRFDLPTATSPLRPAGAEPLTLRSVPTMVDGRLYLHPGSTLTTSAVDFLAPSRALMALTPHLLCVDLDRNRAYPWTEGRCLYGEGGQRRRSSLGSILRSAGSIMMGNVPDREDDEEGDDDDYGDGGGMEAVAALCTVRPPDGSAASAPGLAFTLHSDGSIRMWAPPPPSSRSLRPRRCRRVRVPSELDPPGSPVDFGGGSGGGGGGASAAGGEGGGGRTPVGEDPPLPPPHTWRPTDDSVHLAGLSLPGRTYVLATYVRASDPLRSGLGPGGVGAGDAGEEGAGPCRLLIMYGPAGTRPEEVGTDSALPLMAPDGATDLAGMEFAVAGGGGCELRALYDVRSDREGSVSAGIGGGGSGAPRSHRRGREAVLAVYPPSRTGLSLLDRTPRTADVARTVEDAALGCLRAIRSLADSAGASAADSPPEEAMRAMDARFLKALFRSPLGGASGCRPSPSESAVRGALARLVPSFKPEADGRRVEVDTVLAMREWRRAEEARDALSGGTRGRDQVRDGEGAASTSTSTALVSSRPSDIYSAFATPRLVRRWGSRDEDKGGGDADKDGAKEEGLSEAELRGRRVESHRGRWVRLLLAVREGEAGLLAPLCLACPPPSLSRHGGIAEAAVVVRGGVTSALLLSPSIWPPSPGGDTAEDAVEELDVLALSLLDRIDSDPDRRSDLALLESRVSDAVSRASLVGRKLDSDTQEVLASLGSWAAARPTRPGDAFEETRRGDTSAHRAADLIGTLLSSGDARGWLSAGWLAESAARLALPPLPHPSEDPAGGASEGAAAPAAVGGDEEARRRLAASAAYLSRRCASYARSLALGRALLVAGVPGHDHGGEALLKGALRTYLRAVAVQWVGAQVLKSDEEPPLATGSSAASSAGGRVAASPTASPPGARPRRTTSPPSSGWGRGGTTTTALESRLLVLAGAAGEGGASSSLSLATVGLALSYVRAALGSDDGDGGAAVVGGPPPELGALGDGGGLGGGAAVWRPRLALRLLGPRLAYPPPTDDAGAGGSADPGSRMRRAEAAAEGLLEEARLAERDGAADPGAVLVLRKRAAAFLRDGIPGVVVSWGGGVGAAFEVLMAGPGGDPTPPPPGTGAERSLDGALGDAMRGLVQTSGEEGLARLCRMPTVRSLFLPWVAAASRAGEDVLDFVLRHFPEDGSVEAGPPRAQLEFLVSVLMRMSGLMHCLAVLERRVGLSSSGGGSSPCASARSRADCAGIVLSSIQDVVATARDHLPQVMYEEFMPEYSTLWSSAFHHAVWGRRWHDASEACVNNPIKERRIGNFRRLVLAMADAGAFEEFVDKVLTVWGTKPPGRAASGDDNDAMELDSPDGGGGGMGDSSPADEAAARGPGDELDLYELAAEVLAEAAHDQSRRIGGGGGGGANYCGLMYALHGSRGNWRRAAQAMDFYGVIALSGADAAFELRGEDGSSSPSDSGQGGDAMSKVENERVMADISLSHLGAALAIQLEPKPANRFLVSGELEPYPTPPFFRGLCSSYTTDPIRRSSKRGRDGDQANSLALSKPPADLPDPAVDRASRLMTEAELTSRALKTLALRALHMDSLSPDSVRPILCLSDREAIPALAQLGYYGHCVAVAGCKQRRKGGRRPKGRDVFCDALSYMACRFLAPAAVQLARPAPFNAHHTSSQREREGDADPSTPARPTMAQLCHSLDHCAVAASLPSEPTALTGTISCPSWRTPQLAERAARGAVAMELLRRLTVSHSGPDNTLALEVAGALLDLDGGQAELPTWVVDLLLGRKIGAPETDGTNNECSGLFGNTAGTALSAADPAGLIRLLMRRGLYSRACDVVSSVLTGVNLGSRGAAIRRRATPSRLPEWGGIDFVPYDTIDRLWDLIEAAVSSERDERKRTFLLEARSRMEEALEGHFNMIRVGEMGLQSARALRDL